MKQYSVTTPDNLRSLCIRKNWFTCGTASQYEKLFYANEHGCPIEEIATIIWLCSDDELHCRRDILAELQNALDEYLMSIGDQMIANGERAADEVNGTPLTLINESGLYSLILTSKLPSAKEFKRWVTSSILPMIRKTGMYVTSEAISNGDSSVPMRTLTADDYLAAARLIASCKADRLKLVLSMLGKAGWEIGEQKYALTSGISTADIGPRIQKVLSERNMSWSELAEKTGVSADVLRSYRDGRRFPRPDRYVALVDVLDNLSAEDES